MINPAFIVDGFTEKLIIQQLCPGRPVRRTDLNGKSVSLDAIAKKIASIIRLFNSRYYPIIIVIDKEERKEDYVKITKQLHLKLAENEITDCDIRIGIADRMIENWIIADWECVSAQAEAKPLNTDGINGAAVIKKTKGNYSKTTDGVELFLSANPQTIYINSPSYKDFIDKLQGVECRYLDFDKEAT